MNFQDCAKFANEYPVCYVATMEENQPRVRALRMWFADDKGFYFQTESVKSLCKQLKNNNKVELCFYAPGPNAGTMLRVTGKVEFVNGDMRGTLVQTQIISRALGNRYLLLHQRPPQIEFNYLKRNAPKAERALSETLLKRSDLKKGTVPLNPLKHVNRILKVTPASWDP